MKNTLALVLMVFGISGCQSAAYAYAQVYVNPLISNERKLSHAVQINDFKNTQKYLKSGVSPNTVEYHCDISLMCAPSLIAAFQHEDGLISDLLMSSGGDIDTVFPKETGGLFSRQTGFNPETQMTTLGYWVLMNNESATKRVLTYKPNVNVTFDDSDSLLIKSVFNNNLNITEALLKAGADPNYSNTNSLNSLTVSARHDNIKLSKLLISYGAKPDNKFWSEVRVTKSSTEYIKEVYAALGNTLDGSIYIGSSADLYNSEALVIDADGSRYEGWIEDGKPHGKGSLYIPDGTTFKGDFYMGKLTDGTIELNGNVTEIKNFNVIDDEAAKRLQDEYIKTNNLQNSNDALKGAGEFVLGLAILPLYIVVAALSVVDWEEVAADLPEAHMRAKREQQRVNNAYIRGANAQRARCNNQQGNC